MPNSHLNSFWERPSLLSLMECCNSVKTIAAVIANRNMSHTYLARVGFSRSLRFSTLQPIQYTHTRRRTQPLTLAVAAMAESSNNGFGCVVAPHEPTSPEGKLLTYVLQNKRYFFKFAVSEQLNELASTREGAAAVNTACFASTESVLHRRIAEIKEKERQIAVEDLMYLSIVHKFLEAEIPMVPRLSKFPRNNIIQILPNKRRELESIHSVEVQKLMREYLCTVLPDIIGNSNARGELMSSRINKVQLGQIYAASTMYGYFLKSASFRRYMDLILTRTTENLQPVAEAYSNQGRNLATLEQHTGSQATSLCPESNRSERLSYYINGFDSECMKRCAKLKSREAIDVIERHTWALFGDDKMMELGPDGAVIVMCSSLERLMLEALAFGSFLWEVERSVDSVYTLQIH